MGVGFWMMTVMIYTVLDAGVYAKNCECWHKGFLY